MFVNGILLLNHTNRIVIIATGSSTWSVQQFFSSALWLREGLSDAMVVSLTLLKLIVCWFLYAALFFMIRQQLMASMAAALHLKQTKRHKCLEQS